MVVLVGSGEQAQDRDAPLVEGIEIAYRPDVPALEADGHAQLFARLLHDLPDFGFQAAAVQLQGPLRVAADHVQVDHEPHPLEGNELPLDQGP